MRKLLAIGLSLALLIAAPARAQMLILGVGIPKATGGGGGGYSGPGDVVSGAAAWWGLRAYNAAKATAAAKAVQLCTAADALCTDIHVTSTGDLNAADITTSTCTSTCTVKIWYDQSGNTCDASQATIGNRATFKPATLGTLPTAQSGGFAHYETAFSCTTISSQPYTFSWIGKRTGSFTSEQYPVGYWFGAFSSPYSGWKNVASTLRMSADDATFLDLGSVADSAFHAVQSVFNGASSTLAADGTSGTGAAGTTAFGTPAFFLYGTGSRGAMTGFMAEFGVWASGFSGGQITSMNSNQHTYWGF